MSLCPDSDGNVQKTGCDFLKELLLIVIYI